MRFKISLAVVLLAGLAYAKEPKHYESGTLLRMESVHCGMDENSGHSFAGEVLGTDSAHKKTQELLCQEYVLQADQLTYHIRPKDAKHPALLPVGARAQFRLDKDKMALRVEDGDDKEREYIVVSMTPRESENKTTDTASTKLNHN